MLAVTSYLELIKSNLRPIFCEFSLYFCFSIHDIYLIFFPIYFQPKCVYLTQEADSARNTQSQSGNTALISTQSEALFNDEKEFRQLLARCYLKLGQWQESLNGINEATIPSVLQVSGTGIFYISTTYL